eukprot:TRINITY_DN14448_c0_g1_i1.p1 TRINITY_DN14448_c0_g1~~TRINITY_DN14448_c0_g1_i1.p1  ORF type:complete len:301 (+),score=79.20 TRINITY_DN14448_c0_g1_i1:95-904(+)
MLRSASVLLAAACAASAGRVFVARHGEREDHRNPQWAAHASRAHDSPLSADGRGQAYALGVYLKDLIPADEPVVVYASPLVRAVQTAFYALQGMGRAEEERIGVEQCLSETETSLRRRMLGTHDKSVPKADGVYSGVCTPVLLSPGDLMTAAPIIDLGYSSAVQIEHDAAGWEVVDGLNRTMVERIRSCVPDVLGLERNEGKTVLLFTHGGAARHAVNRLAGGELFKSISYCQVFELATQEGVCGGDDPTHTLVATWHPKLNEGVSGKD